MGKPEKGTPKEIANRCKSKGLQKLRWFCQMCRKQCRDQNGFKCHLTSESHQRQLLLFAENPNIYLKEFSIDFERNFLTVLRNTFGTKRVRANEVYQEYIRDKMHVHMNSTTWHTLTNFVLYLGSSGKCRIDHTERGWYIALIDQEEELRAEKEKNKAKAEINDAEQHMLMIEKQAERAREKAAEKEEKHHSPTEFRRDENDEKITFALPAKFNTEIAAKPSTSLLFGTKLKNERKEESENSAQGKFGGKRKYSINKTEEENDSSNFSEKNFRREIKSEVKSELSVRERENVSSTKNKIKKSALDELMEMEERKKEKQNRKDYWLHKGIIVKIMTKKLGMEFYKAKGVVTSLIDNYVSLVDVNGHLLKIDQNHLETVIPAVGRRMLIVNGAYRGLKAVLEAIEESNFAVRLRIVEGLTKGRIISVPYEDACKLSETSK